MSTQYIYSCSKARAMKSHLLTERDYDTLIGSSIEDIQHYLEGMPGYEFIEELSLKDMPPLKVEKLLTERFLRILFDFMTSLPEDARAFFTVYATKRIEIDNMKSLIRVKTMKISEEEVMDHLITLDTQMLERYLSILKQAVDIESLVDLLKEAEYGDILEEALSEYKKTNSLLPFTYLLDRHYYETIWGRLTSLRGINKRSATDLIGTEIDLANIKAILRCKFMKIDKADIRKYITPIYFRLDQSVIESGIDAKDIEEALGTFAIKLYEAPLSSAYEKYRETHSLSDVELILDKFLIAYSRGSFIRYPSPYHLGVVLALLNLKRNEIRNIRTILYGKKLRIEPGRLKKLLVIA